MNTSIAYDKSMKRNALQETYSGSRIRVADFQADHEFFHRNIRSFNKGKCERELGAGIISLGCPSSILVFRLANPLAPVVVADLLPKLLFVGHKRGAFRHFTDLKGVARQSFPKLPFVGNKRGAMPDLTDMKGVTVHSAQKPPFFWGMRSAMADLTDLKRVTGHSLPKPLFVRNKRGEEKKYFQYFFMFLLSFLTTVIEGVHVHEILHAGVLLCVVQKCRTYDIFPWIFCLRAFSKRFVTIGFRRLQEPDRCMSPQQISLPRRNCTDNIRRHQTPKKL